MVCVCACPHQPRPYYGAFAAEYVGARAPVAAGVAIAVAFATGFVKEQVEASEFGDPMSERLTRYRGGVECWDMLFQRIAQVIC